MNRHHRWFSALVFPSFTGATLAGCSGAPPPAAAAPAAYAAELTAPEPYDTTDSAEEALAQLDRAESALDSVLGRPLSTRSHAAPPSATPASGTSTEEAAPTKKSDDASRVHTDPCDTACRALASMERAAQRLCDLAGASDQRCEGAKTRVNSASDRVQAQCPRCAAR